MTVQKRPEEYNLLSHDVQNCPYEAYQAMRDQAPVYKDPRTGFYIISRYEDVRKVLLDTENFGNGPVQNEQRRQTVHTERVAKVRRLYEEKGWLPAPTLAGRDDPNHAQMRALFDKAFRAGKIRELDGFVKDTAYKLIDAFVNDGEADIVHQFSVPLPLIVIGRQMGVPEEDIWKIKKWTDAWVKRLGMMLTEAEELWSVEQEIEAQHYFQPIFDRLRKQPDDTLLSDLVNAVIPEWGRPLNDNELHAEMMADTFVGGSETSTNAISAGIMLLCQNPESWKRLKSEPDKYMKTFVEEVLRLESPVQLLFRGVRNDVTLHGVTIPKGSTVNIAYAAANRDERHFECPEKLDIDRRNSGSHMAFGSGIHHCLGAPLARRELWWAFSAFVDRIEDMEFVPGKNNFHVQPNYCLRALQELHIRFTPKAKAN